MRLKYDGGTVDGSPKGADLPAQTREGERLDLAGTDIERMRETFKFFQKRDPLPAQESLPTKQSLPAKESLPSDFFYVKADKKTESPPAKPEWTPDKETLDKIGKDLYELIKQNKDAKFTEDQLKEITDHLRKAYAKDGMPNVIIEERKILKGLNEAIQKYFRLHTGMSVDKCPYALERVFDAEFPEKRRWVFKEKMMDEKIKEHFKETIDVRGSKK